MCVLKEAMHGAPRGWEFVANLEEELMGKVEINGGKFVTEFEV